MQRRSLTRLDSVCYKMLPLITAFFVAVVPALHADLCFQGQETKSCPTGQEFVKSKKLSCGRNAVAMNLCKKEGDRMVAKMAFLKRSRHPHGCCKCSSQDEYMDVGTEQCVSKQACMPTLLNLYPSPRRVALLCVWPDQNWTASPGTLCENADGSFQVSETLSGGNKEYFTTRTKVCIQSQQAGGRKRAIDAFKHYNEHKCCKCNDASLYFDMSKNPMGCVTRETCEA